MEKSMEMMAQAINSLGQQVGNGLMMIVQSLSANNLLWHILMYIRGTSINSGNSFLPIQVERGYLGA